MVDPRLVEAYEKHATALVRYAAALVGVQDAEDIVGDALVRVAHSSGWDRVVDERGYLFRCVLNEATRRGRRDSMRRVREPLSPKRVGGHRSGVDELGVFGVLSPRERAAIYLTYWEDLRVAEVAQLLGLSDGSVRRYLARARTKLRKELRDERP